MRQEMEIMMTKIYTGKEAKELYLKGEDRLEYLNQHGDWSIYDHIFDRPSKFEFYDKWRIY